MPKEDQQDILTVQNIDLNCNDVDTEEGWSHADFFQVKYGGQPIRVKPGETRKMPRYLAEHYAKHLANHILFKLEEETGRQFLVNNIVERPRVLKEILVGVDQYFKEQGETKDDSAGERAAAEIEQLNQPEEVEDKALDLGVVPNSAMGVLTNEVTKTELKEEESKTESGTSIFDPKKPNPPMPELMKECKKLGIKFDLKKDNQKSLIAKLKAF